MHLSNSDKKITSGRFLSKPKVTKTAKIACSNFERIQCFFYDKSVPMSIHNHKDKSRTLQTIWDRLYKAISINVKIFYRYADSTPKIIGGFMY